MTNEIVRAEIPEYITNTLRLFNAELQRGETDYFGMLTRLAVIIDSKASSDTAKRIFAEIKNADDKLVNPNYNNLKTIINTIKKKYEVD